MRRRDRFIRELVAARLFPLDKAEQQALVSLNPYRLRAEGLTRELSPYELGRALFHLQQRRGFKSNRRTDKTTTDPEKETSKLKNAIRDFAGDVEGSTVGAELWRRIQAGQPARARLIGSGPKATYTFYVAREMVAHEFDALWEMQRPYHPNLLTENARERLRDVLLFQRDLIPQDVGRCFYERQDFRAPIALPSAQQFRLYQEVNHLRARNVSNLDERSLTRQERDTVVTLLMNSGEKTFSSIRKAIFGSNSGNWRFTIEDEKRSKLKGNQVSAKLSSDKAFGDQWHALLLEEQDRIVEELLDIENEHVLIDRLIKEFDLTEVQAQYVSDLPLPNGHLRIGRVAIGKILPALIDGWDDGSNHALSYDQAVLAAGYRSHSQTHDGTLHDLLPYYGEILYRYTMPAEKASDANERQFGKIGNPTVHIGLNQVRKVVNALIAKYGLPTEVVLELARELKLSQDDKDKLAEQQKRNQDENDAIRTELIKLGQSDNHDNRLRLKLFNELPRPASVCAYTGRTISVGTLFTNEWQVDHILPLSVTLDDGYANKVLVHNSANRFKGNRSPYEAFGASPAGYDWNDILERSKSLPQNKRRRFSPDAMKEAGEQKDFLARQLNDTAYLARVSKQYLEAICPNVWVTPGRLTGLLRGKWNLNSILSDTGKKERTDHRHHAVDAAVIAVTDRGLLNVVSRAAARAEIEDLSRSFAEISQPWPSFREELVAAAQRVVISYKPDHGTGSQLHNDTAYGIVSGPDATGKFRVRHRIPIESVREKHLKDLDCDDTFRNKLEIAILSASGVAEITRNLTTLKEETGRRSLRLVETLSVLPIYAKGQSPLDGAEPYKAYKGDSNYCYEIYRTEKEKWGGRIISSFEASSKPYQDFQKSSRYRAETWSGESLVMRIMKDDLVAIEENEIRRIMRVQKITLGTISMAEHQEGNVDARERDSESDFSYMRKTPNTLRQVQARRAFVDVIGNVFDPGFKNELG